MRIGNKGFSLVEVIVSLAIMGIVAGTVSAFVVAGNNSYMRGNQELTLQEEAQLTANQIIDMVIDVEKGITFTAGTGGNGYDMNGNVVAGGVAYKELRLYNEDNVYMLRWQGDNGMGYANANEVYFCEAANRWLDSTGAEVPKGTAGATLEIGSPDAAKGSLMAQHVDSFFVDLSDLDDRKVVLNMTYKYQDREYEVTETIKLRNSIVTEASPAAMYPDGPIVYNWIDTIKILPEHAELRRRTAFDFDYELTGDAEAVNLGVDWSVAKADGSSLDAGTYIDSNGKLTIGDAETIGTDVLLVTCTAKADGTKSATATVTVLPGGVTSLTIQPKDAIVMQGNTQQFTYVMDGTPDALAAGVTWEVEALDDSAITGTTAISADGLLQVDENQETGARILKVTVVSVTNNAMTDSAYVTVVPHSTIDGKYDARLIATTLTTYEFEEDGETKVGYMADIECLPNYADYLNGYPRILWEETTNPSAYEIKETSQFTSTLYCGNQRNTTAYVQATIQLSAEVTVVIGIDINIPDLLTVVDEEAPYIESDQFVLNRNGMVHCWIENYEGDASKLKWQFEDGKGLTSTNDDARMIGFGFRDEAYWDFEAGETDPDVSNYDSVNNTRNYNPTGMGAEVDVRAKWCVDWEQEYRLKLQALNEKGTIVAETYILIPRFDILFTDGEHYSNLYRNTWYNKYYLQVYGFYIGTSEDSSEGVSGGSGDFRLSLEGNLEAEKSMNAGTNIAHISFDATSDYVAMNVSGEEKNEFIMLNLWDDRRPESKRMLMFILKDKDGR